jgi:hypothetical protein
VKNVHLSDETLLEDPPEIPRSDFKFTTYDVESMFYEMFFSWRAQKSLKTVYDNIMLALCFFGKGSNCRSFKINFTVVAHSKQN